MRVLDEKIDTEFIILLKMYLILKRLVWNKAEFIEDSLIELDDNRIEYDVILTSEFGEPGWSISFSTKDTSVQKHAIVLNVLSQIDKRIKGKGLFRVSSNGSGYLYHITQR